MPMNHEINPLLRPKHLALLLRLAAVATIAVVAALAVSCGDDDDATPTAAPTATTEATSGGIKLPAGVTTVTISDNKFTPLSLQLPVGTTVTWDWSGRNPHSVVGSWDDAEVHSPQQKGSGTFQFKFEHQGIFEYHCGVHGEAMSGTVTIQ